MKRQVLFLEYNEINFEFLQHYIALGKLPNFARCFAKYGYSRTTSETRYEDLEPWIQWVSAHTGMSLAEHGVFRLGDIVRHEIPQIWERLEDKGYKVGAISPMNAKNRTHDAAFFVPDPWTRTEITGPALLKKLYDAIAQAVNDNAQSKLTASSMAWLLAGTAGQARPANYGEYIRLAAGARWKSWSKALFLDLLLADMFIRQTRRTTPDFATLFLNAAAHIQHHYMFSSTVYEGPRRNPTWYVPEGEDPLLEAYSLYDRLLGQVRAAFPSARILMATGLHQDPHGAVTFYWRLADHASFLRRLGVPFVSVQPRMSRDFLVVCSSVEDARKAAEILESAADRSGVPLFEVDNRGSDLFITLTYPADIDEGFVYRVGDSTYSGFRKDIAFVAIKNGEHNGIGYFADMGAPKGTHEPVFPITSIPSKVFAAVGVEQGQEGKTRFFQLVRSASASAH